MEFLSSRPVRNSNLTLESLTSKKGGKKRGVHFSPLGKGFLRIMRARTRLAADAKG